MIEHKLNYVLFFLFPVLCSAQINQKDAEGRRHGLWKVNFEGTQNPKFEGSFNHGSETGVFKFYKQGFYNHPAAIMNFGDGKDSVDVVYYTQQGKPISKGKIVDKKREGEWVYYHQKSDSVMMTEIYKNDKLNGLQKTYFTNGQLAEKTNYLNGEKDGESLIYADNGNVMKQLNYKDGKLNGPAYYFTASGEKSIDGFYSKGVKTGTWKYYKDGKLDEEKEY